MAMGGSLPPKSELALTQSPEQVRATSSGPKKKGTVRAWLVLNTTGQAQVLEAGKSDIMSRTGLPGRDLRSLDPVLSYPSSILGRERAIVINLENIKAIVTHNEVLLLNSRDPSVTPFIEELQKRLHFHYHSCHTQVRALLISSNVWNKTPAILHWEKIGSKCLEYFLVLWAYRAARGALHTSVAQDTNS